MPEAPAPFRAEAIARAPPGRIVGPALPPSTPRPVARRLLALLGLRRAPAPRCPTGACA